MRAVKNEGFDRHCRAPIVQSRDDKISLPRFKRFGEHVGDAEHCLSLAVLQ